MDALFKLEGSVAKGLIPESVAKLVRRRFRYVVEGVKRVERASGAKYPDCYVEPTLTVVAAPSEPGQVGILYARVVPSDEPIFRIYVELSCPLVAYAKKTTIHAVLGHEFLHYAYLVKKLVGFEVLSDEISQSIFEAKYADSGSLIGPSLIFNDRALVRLINSRFRNGFVDKELDKKTMKRWIDKSLSTRTIPPEMNVIRLPATAAMMADFDEKIKMRLHEIFRIQRPS